MAKLYNHGHKVVDLKKDGYTTYRLMSDGKWLKSKPQGWKMAKFAPDIKILAHLLSRGFVATIYDSQALGLSAEVEKS